METLNPIDMNEKQKDVALNYYKRQLMRIKKYNEEHKEKINEANLKNYFKMKEDPERYKLYLEKKRLEYKEKKAKKTNI